MYVLTRSTKEQEVARCVELQSAIPITFIAVCIVDLYNEGAMRSIDLRPKRSLSKSTQIIFFARLAHY